MEQLGSLQIETSEESTSNEQTDTEMSAAPAPMEVTGQENGQARLLKNMVLDPRWFDSNRMKFEDWWRGIRLFLKSNRVMETDNRIIVILACLRRGVAGIYTQ